MSQKIEVKSEVGGLSYTVGPNKMLNLVLKGFDPARFKTVLIPPQIKGEGMRRLDELAKCDVLLVGFSSFNPEEEMDVVRALAGKVKIVNIEDVPQSSLRPGIQDGLKYVLTTLVSLPGLESDAKNFGYPRADYVAPPPHWGDAYNKMVAADGVREKCTVLEHGASRPLAKNDIVIGINAVKTPWINNRMVQCLTAAAPEGFVFGIRPHPGQFKETEEQRADTAKLPGLIKDLPLLKLPSDKPSEYTGGTQEEFWRAVNLMVCAGGPTDSLPASWLGIPMLYFEDADTIENDKFQTPVSRGWLSVRLEPEFLVHDVPSLKKAISYLLTPEGREALRARQAKMFPKPDDLNTAPKIAAFVEQEVLGIHAQA